MTKRSKLALYVACAALPLALFLAVAAWVYDGPCPDAGAVRSTQTPAGERMEFCAVRGVKHGPFAVVNGEGQRTAEGGHVDGALHGAYRRYDEGVLVEVKCFSHGSIQWTTRDVEDIKTRKCTTTEAGK